MAILEAVRYFTTITIFISSLVLYLRFTTANVGLPDYRRLPQTNISSPQTNFYLSQTNSNVWESYLEDG